MSENVGASTSLNPKGLHGLYGDNFTFTLPFNHQCSDMKCGLQQGSDHELFYNTQRIHITSASNESSFGTIAIDKASTA
jgi:hypothetical protein